MTRFRIFSHYLRISPTLHSCSWVGIEHPRCLLAQPLSRFGFAPSGWGSSLSVYRRGQGMSLGAQSIVPVSVVVGPGYWGSDHYLTPKLQNHLAD